MVQYQETSNPNHLGSIETKYDFFKNSGIELAITPKFIGSKICVSYTCSVPKVMPNHQMEIALSQEGVLDFFNNPEQSKLVTGYYGLGYVSSDGGTVYSPVTGSYVFTTTSLSPHNFFVCYRTVRGATDPVTLVHDKSSYILSATEYAQ